MVKLKSIMRENGLIDVLLKRSKTQRVMLFLLFLAIDIACFCLTVVSDYTIRSVFALLFGVYMLSLACRCDGAAEQMEILRRKPRDGYLSDLGDNGHTDFADPERERTADLFFHQSGWRVCSQWI